MTLPSMTVRQMLELAEASSRAGRFLEAEQLYRDVLAIQPDHGEALQMLGMLAHRAGRMDEAAKLLRRAASGNPQAAEIHANLGILLAQLGNWDEAIIALGAR